MRTITIIQDGVCAHAKQLIRRVGIESRELSSPAAEVDEAFEIILRGLEWAGMGQDMVTS